MMATDGKSLLQNALRHVLAGVIMQLVVWLLFGLACGSSAGVCAGALAVTAYFVSRERRDHEIKARIPVRFWYRGWDIWNWSADGKADLLPVVSVVWLIALAGVLL